MIFYEKVYHSFGKSIVRMQKAILPSWQHELIDSLNKFESFLLAHGRGLSYGDCCLIPDGVLIDTRFLNRIRKFDSQKGIITCEAGVGFDHILKLIVPYGWLIPVLAGTKFITVGGAVANDIHGKNHHHMGSFGCHVENLKLLCGDGKILSLHPGDDLFQATIGGLGLTGVILEVTFKLIKRNPWLNAEYIKLRNLDDFFAIDQESDNFEYSVAWIDSFASGSRLGRGIYMRANHEAEIRFFPKKTFYHPIATIPLDLPSWILNKYIVRSFNEFYYHKQLVRNKKNYIYYDKFFFPLDAISAWNRIYGKPGFFQFQCVIEHDYKTNFREILNCIAKSSLGSFLAVLKRFGSLSSSGLMSFPTSGYTLAIDVKNHHPEVSKLFSKLYEIVFACGGRIYPAKDALMPASMFREGYGKNLEKFERLVDKRFTSFFWKRMQA